MTVPTPSPDFASARLAMVESQLRPQGVTDRGVLAAMGKLGKGPGEFGEAHMIAVNSKGDIYVADSVNATLVKFVKK